MTEEPQGLERDKLVAYYSALYGAWVGTRMEKDRALLTLSSGGVGLLVTLLTTVGVNASWQFVLYGLDALVFGIAIVMAVLIFDRNAEYVKQLAKGESLVEDLWLVRMDRTLITSFVLGVVLLATIGLSSAYLQFTQHGG